MNVTTMVLNDMGTNTYIVIGNCEAVVVDPSDDARFIIDHLAEKHITKIAVLLTHGHFDHIGAVAELKKHGATVYISQKDYELIDFDNKYDVFFSRDKFDMDVAVKDGDIFELAEHEFKVISTPGHSPGSVCYIMDDLIIFSGDTLFKNGVGRTDFEHGDFSLLTTSLKKLAALKGDYSILPGHGPNTALDDERKNNPYVR